MTFRTFALFSLFSWAAVVANPLASGDFWSSVDNLRFAADSITRDSAVFWQFPLASSANTVLKDVTTFNSQVQTALTQVPTAMMSEEDAENTRRAFVGMYDDTRDGFNALNGAAKFLEPFGLVPTFCSLIQCITTGMHILVNETLAITPAIVPSKRLRNKISGFTTHLMKRIPKGPIHGISFKLQEEEHERKDNYVPEVSALATSLEVDAETKELPHAFNFDTIQVSVIQLAIPERVPRRERRNVPGAGR
ncbi:ribosomal S17-domain-containing protein [Armillaria nabsnona]|nr:ribosomal S17-domain-containing protein [Armillaria nabsnona]